MLCRAIESQGRTKSERCITSSSVPQAQHTHPRHRTGTKLQLLFQRRPRYPYKGRRVCAGPASKRPAVSAAKNKKISKTRDNTRRSPPGDPIVTRELTLALRSLAWLAQGCQETVGFVPHCPREKKIPVGEGRPNSPVLLFRVLRSGGWAVGAPTTILHPDTHFSYNLSLRIPKLLLFRCWHGRLHAPSFSSRFYYRVF